MKREEVQALKVGDKFSINGNIFEIQEIDPIAESVKTVNGELFQYRALELHLCHKL